MQNLIGIVAFDDNAGIGYEGKMPWYFKEDLEHFKNTTINHSVIMGRKTWDSIGRKVLKRRNHIILSNTDSDYEPFYTYDEAIDRVKSDENGKYFVIGGASIYNLFFDKIDMFIVTHIYGKYQNDTKFNYKKLYGEFKVDGSKVLSESCEVKTYSRKQK
jgi:dihydrofolate reductase